MRTRDSIPNPASVAQPNDRSASVVRCTHCALPVPAGLIEEGEDHQFCCGACRIAYHAIHAAGLDRYYAIREAAGARWRAGGSDRAYAEFDDPAFLALYATAESEIKSRIELRVENLHCAACLWVLEKVPEVTAGVLESRVSFGSSRLEIAWDPTRTSLSAVARFVDALGYPVHPMRSRAIEEVRTREDRAALVRIGIAGALAGNTMLLGLALYAGLFSGMESRFLLLFRGISMALGLISVFGPGMVFLRGAWAGLRMRTLNMDVPVALGLLVGALWGSANVLRQSGEVYFDTITTLVFLLLVGRWMQTTHQRKAADAVELLHALTPSTARVVDPDGTERTVPSASVAIGQTVIVGPGAVIPADGAIEVGESAVDESVLTGESRPIPVGIGRAVYAGTTNLVAPIRVVVSASGALTRAAHMMRMVEDAAASRPPIVRLADRIAARFVGAVIVLAGITLAIWMRIDSARAIDNAASLLIVTCPCALALATPLAISAAIGRAARRGMLVKGGDALESLASRGVIYLDKTGTITEGRAAVVRWIGPDRLRADVAAIERTIVHPIAIALSADADPEVVAVAESVRAIPGAGVEGTVAGRRIAAWSADHATRELRRLPESIRAGVDAALAECLTPIVIVEDGIPSAVACIGDPIRDDARESIAAIRERGWDVRILSGDHPEIVRAVATRVGIDPDHARGGASPEDKLAVIRSARDAGTAVMVGDGVNDAASLAAATVGIAVHGGAEASMTAADVFISTPGLAPVVSLVDGARRTITVIRRNAIASIAYNTICISAAMAGYIGPLLAAILMPISSLTVVMISARTRIFRDSHP